jgi:Fe-S cluster biogenesis protein NfuA
VADSPDIPEGDIRATGDRIERLLDQLHAGADPQSYACAEELLRLVTELYGAGLARIVALVEEEDPLLLGRLADDGLVASLLMVHELHPDSIEARVQKALETVRPFLAGHGGDVELLGLDAARGAVHLRLLGSCDGCPSSSVTLQLAVERAIVEAAPEIVTIDVEQPTKTGASVPIGLTRKPEPAVAYDPATGCGAVAGDAA